MEKDRLIFEAIEEIYDADDAGTEHPDIFKRRVIVAVQAAWADGISLQMLVGAAREKLARGAG